MIQRSIALMEKAWQRIKLPYLLFAIGIFIVEVLIATVFSGIPFIRAFLGDYLVVILLYCLIRAFWNIAPSTLSVAIFLFACAVEIAQALHLADILGLPAGSLLSILIGTSFSWIDILMYGLGCLTAFLVDTIRLHGILPRNPSS
ncbi:MAG: DUF2809 domain-containing protein [Anaerolineae bacterium]|nr:DUF2809 domain-containing protein [Anaerolineae bacterium]